MCPGSATESVHVQMPVVSVCDDRRGVSRASEHLEQDINWQPFERWLASTGLAKFAVRWHLQGTF